MKSNMPKSAKRQKSLALKVAVLSAALYTIEIGSGKMSGTIEPFQSNMNVSNEDVFFETPETTNSATYELINEKQLNDSSITSEIEVASVEEPSDGLVGETTAEKIYNYLIANGLTKAGAAGLMGNLSAESGLVSIRLQGDFTEGYWKSQEYTDNVDSGEISRYQFVHNGPGGGGYGLAQWTFHTRKAALYDYAESQGKSVGDLKTQLEFLMIELAKYSNVYSTLTTTDDLREATRVVLYEYERPKYKNLEARLNLAKQFYN